MRFKKFSDDWNKYKLSQVCNYSNTKGIRSKKYYVSTENINSNYSGISQYNDDVQVKGTTFKKGDILLSNIRPYLKKAWLANFDGVTNQDVLVLHATNIYSPFLYQIVASQSFVDYVMSSVKGIKMPRGDKDQIMEYQIHIPSPTEQNSIVKFLEMLDSRIETQNKIISALEFQKKYLTNNIVDMKSTSYRFEKLYDFASEGGTPSTQFGEYYEKGDVPFIKIDDLYEKYIVKNKSTITRLGLQKSSAWLVPSNSIIYSNGATVGKIAINTFPVSTKQGILGIIPSKLVTTEYLYYFMSSLYFRKQVHRIIVKGTMECAYLKDLNKITCFIPTIKKQEQMVTLLKIIDRKLEIEQAILQKYKEQKRFLLSNMFI